MEIKINSKMLLIVLAVVAVVVLVTVLAVIGVRNHAIALEEGVYNANAQVEAQEKRRVDLVYNLVDIVQDYADYEHDTMMDVIAARTKNGTIDEEGSSATNEINVVAEAYPDLKASEQYVQLMTELATTENLIFTYRSSYNDSVREYRSYVRKFPASVIVGDPVEFEYLEFNAPSDAPQNLFD